MDATLTISATVPGGCVSMAAELEQLELAVRAALQQVRGAGGHQRDGTVKTAFDAATATFTFVPVASK